MGIYDRQTGGQGVEAIMVEKLWRYLKVAAKNVDDIAGFWNYHHFYLAQAKYQHGGKEWRDYYKEISRELLQRQAPNGTWPGDDVGPVYGTAAACFILQLPYGYLPICQR